MIFLSGMNALLDRFHNFILPFLRGEDRVCQCTCGSHQAYHVVPYHGALSMDSTQNYLRGHIMTQQESSMVVGLLLGLCISWFLLWLISVWNLTFKFWWTNQLNSE
ncbi:transmembrane protein 240 [Parambassis ranga]|uniref:Transmembrane protein 240 n=1 Tax=Parambassis ranga TaxID=210632 RepID=A0A6P7IDI8_9TELE|nr:transmembrane protein 240 [Parambassis ranga]